MDITYTLFDALRTFDNLRRQNRQDYLNFIKAHERFKGSEGYNKDKAAAAQKRQQADDAARKAAAEKIDACIKQMRENIGKMALAAPTAEMVNILQILNMKTSMTKGELDAAAQAMNGNSLALSALNDIADKHFPKTDVKGLPLDKRYHTNYMQYAQGLGGDLAGRYLDSIIHECKEILKSPVKSHIVENARIQQSRYGTAYDIDDLPQRGELVSERGFFGDIVPETDYAQFMQAANGKEARKE